VKAAAAPHLEGSGTGKNEPVSTPLGQRLVSALLARHMAWPGWGAVGLMLLESIARMGDDEVACSLWWLDDENVDPNGSS
jgi:hypothetical protein